MGLIWSYKVIDGGKRGREVEGRREKLEEGGSWRGGRIDNEWMGGREVDCRGGYEEKWR